MMRRIHKNKSGQRVTLNQIARAAGVSVATASRVMAGNGNVSPEFERRVLDAVRQLTPPKADQAKSGLFALLLGNRPILHGFHARVMRGVESFFLERGSSTVFYPMHYSADAPWSEVPLPKILQPPSAPVDGFIVAGTNSSNLLDLLARLDRPFAVYGNNVCGEWDERRYDCVFSDDFGGAYDVTAYLTGLKHRHIWFMADIELPWRRRRYDGYRQAIADAGLDPHVSPLTLPNETDAGYLAAKTVLNSGEPVDAIVAGGDPAAQGAYAAFRERRKQVGVDVSIVGFDDFSEATAMHPPLTTVCTFPEEIGRRLAEMVWRRAADPDRPIEKVVMPTRLIKRESIRAAGPELDDAARLIELGLS